MSAERAAGLERYERIILGIDPGTNVMGFGILGVMARKACLIDLGSLKMVRTETHYLRLKRIFDYTRDLCERFLPDELAIEAPFYGKNVQSMLKLGRAQGVAMAAALSRDIPVCEYEPRKIKQAITGNGAASKEQVQSMLKHILGIAESRLPHELDATDALAAALCHFYESGKPVVARSGSWKDYIAKHPDKIR